MGAGIDRLADMPAWELYYAPNLQEVGMDRIASAATEPDGQDEIGITEAMAKAGADIICCYWGDLMGKPSPALREEVAREVYRAMRGSN